MNQNKALLTGVIQRTHEHVPSTGQGNKAVFFTLYTETMADNRLQKAYIPCTYWNPPADEADLIVKGKTVTVQGRIKSYSKEMGEAGNPAIKPGEKIVLSMLEIVCERVSDPNAAAPKEEPPATVADIKDIFNQA